jgi:hypothetical protein
MRQLVAKNIQKITNKKNTTKEKRQTVHTKHDHIEWNAIETLRQNKSVSTNNNQS